MRILKNQCLVLLIAMLLLPVLYLLYAPASSLATILFVTAMLIMVWAADTAAEQKPYEEGWVDPDWTPSKDDGKTMIPCFLWIQ